MVNKNLLSVKEAINEIVNNLQVLQSEDIELTNALGRTNASKIISKLNNPPQDVSSMDGYAVNSKIKFQNYKIIGESSAGNPYINSISDGETVQIFTGAYLPKGADSVVIQENTKLKSKNFVYFKDDKVLKNRHIRKKGLDFKVGDMILDKNNIIKSRDISTIAMSGNFWLNVRIKPTIGILSTGDEIEKVGELLNKNKIPSGNNIMLAAMIKIFGGTPRILPISKDNKKSIKKIIESNLDCNLLISTGGASVGKYDYLSQFFNKKQVFTSFDFWKIAMRPGKPLIFGKIQNTPLLGIPGNPVSAGVCSLIFLRAAIRKMLGLKNFFPDIYEGVTTSDIDENDNRMDFIRSTLKINSKNFVSPFVKQDSSMTNIFSKSNCLIIRKPFQKKSTAGDIVHFIKYPDFY